MAERKRKLKDIESEEKDLEQIDDQETFTESVSESTQVFSVSNVPLDGFDNAAPSSLVLLVGPTENVGRQWSLQVNQMIIGRSSMSHILLSDNSVSKSHAKLLVEDDETFIQDLKSTNKTYINGEELSPLKKVLLKNNDQIKVGNIIFKFLAKGTIENMSAAKSFHLSIYDSLTKTYNRRAFDNHVPEEFKKARKLGMSFTLIIFDLDHFKNVNDRHGHTAGDYVLRETCSLISSKLLRSTDIFARFGGEEFCLLLPGSNLQQALKKSEEMRKIIDEHAFVFEGEEIPVTISLGATEIQETDKGWEDMFQRADDALYKSKQSGRNKVSS